MSQVTIDVGGRTYTVSCGDGEEARIRKLGELIDAKVSSVTGGKPAAEGQALLFAALLLADELQDAQKAAQQAAKPSVMDDPNLAAMLEKFAEVIENCAEKLESRIAAP